MVGGSVLLCLASTGLGGGEEKIDRICRLAAYAVGSVPLWYVSRMAVV